MRVEGQFINVIIYNKLLAYYYYYRIDLCFKGMKWRDHKTYIKGNKYKLKYVIKSYEKRSLGRSSCSWEIHANVHIILRGCNGAPDVRI